MSQIRKFSVKCVLCLPIVHSRLGTPCDRTNSRHFLSRKSGSSVPTGIGTQASRLLSHPSWPHSMFIVSPWPEMQRWEPSAHCKISYTTQIFACISVINTDQSGPEAAWWWQWGSCHGPGTDPIVTTWQCECGGVYLCLHWCCNWQALPRAARCHPGPVSVLSHLFIRY